MTKEKSIEKLNELLKGENMAAHIYHKTKNLQQDAQVADMFARFAKDHRRHAQQLKNRIKELGGTPKADMDTAKVMAKIKSIINSLRGPKHIIKQVYNGEDKGVHAYEDRIDELDSKSQQLVKQIMNEDQKHLKNFEKRVEQER
ncbi:demethoxyubiquinone hydroxylase family protein [Fuchsiella alkaliacetigena]|uniref:demethoxyubiquinone hydroxylase family protein n=1 Tax=Fuchsiella alkaliacetigena TaxID=957042 RepID=UPI00200B91F9|nr:demethoxyubiquinone hydroxylase family protein [Fuchsiella alkaliacetigena]MCK8824625.1 PA2169 family four-helix-bundle protein [Fuchsiella alkaliacetigena]